MVAAWINAETGVGPSMASGNQLKRGIWALLPVAASSNASTTRVAIIGVSVPERSKMVR